MEPGSNIKSDICREAARLGFLYCGFGSTGPFNDLKEFYAKYLAEHRQASMDYIERYAGTRLDPRLLMPEARSVIALLMNYYPAEIIPEEDNFIIAKYAYGKDDYIAVKERLSSLIGFLKDSFGSIHSHAYCDSGPLLEKALARRCGVGWIGKNTILINKNNGSFFLIGIILTDLEIEPDEPEPDHCGNCDKCMKACPTGAIDRPYQLNIARCIAYLTIETKHPVPEEYFPKLNDRIYGCDICQDVCPFNKFASPQTDPKFVRSEKLKILRKKEWMELDEQGFNDLFRDSCVKRTGFSKLTSTIEGINRHPKV